ncbi:hypothetical protein CHLNCDRAFT_55184 [Chlorella variabilis]|uniref:Pectin acetylesterase n=1 Tax=Chlorella variabilis TaxID=554065 RepID=E1ZS53_CHLVA|nr:hypothetical protein CHLNCDRAFT_55184 [Chlorella variabilis]EFN51328.1 hypothetical protein CHLNCDRAFT_55184 [Chlorella variabilis]|eukprot:XP_005843430.1 hypothetical protein CHLNCDRAFT_55184 [Chlorella variabilis]
MPSGASTAALAALALLPLALAGAPADASLNAAGLPLMTPTSASAANHTYYFEIPIDPVGLLVMLHRCGRSAEDFWPPSGACPECIGMPEAVSISRQALARGYALLAINSFNRTVGSLGRCWSLATDALPVRELVTAFRQLHGLADLPLFVTGCSSGGLLALRLPSFMALDGIMPVAIGLDLDSFPPNLPRQNHTYPPVAYFHFSRDNTTTTQVEAMVEFSQAAGLPASQVTVQPSQFTPDFFSQRDPLIRHAGATRRMPRAGEGWTEEVSTVELRQEVERVAEAAGAVSSYCVAESGDGTAADLTPDLLYHHVLEELGVAWAEHTNLGDYTAATLVWLERCGTGE